MPDDSFHDVRVNGKQLVFTFMAATVVAVVIFLCGILVGRGIPSQRSELIAAEQGGVDPTAGVTPSGLPLPPPSSAGSNTSGASRATNETLSYPERLATDAPPPEALEEPDPTQTPSSADRPAAALTPKTPAAKTPISRTEAETPAVSSPLAKSPDNALVSSVSPPASDMVAGAAEGTYAVQVAAVRGRAEADRMVKRLVSKGYRAYVSAPSTAAPRVFRVRVGKFNDRRQADSVAGRLKREERFKPWVTR